MSISANEIIEIVEKYGKKRSISMDFKEGGTELTDSKLAGIPYLPKDSQWPLDKKTGEKLVFMLQVNFSEVPKMENYPESGLMQIFIANDDISGIDFDEPDNQASWRIIFHENIDNAMEVDEIKALMPDLNEADDVMLPFDPQKEYKVTFKEEMQLPSIDTLEFDKIFKEHIGAAFGIESISDLDDVAQDELFDKLCNGGSRIGGYPFFTQYEIREENDTRKLLIQIDSVYDDKMDIIIWGDSGVANFFITDEDLKNRDFSHVIYNWDCY